ncbi:phenoloxidase-activating factor 2-like [Melitaea cinxia]|uniref:phenoloxidase-activating factor 2-like n=1 Tax=Melitaea cinxia TaxID=113334 RepID=UPI001E272643|nr:phenoloxidase-activating factor 2-like [Melitaea cinxia]
MWLQLVYISCSLLLIRAASAEGAELNNINLSQYRKCVHQSGEEARCVKKSLCKQLPLLDESIGFTYRELVAGSCPYLQTCCPESQINLTLLSHYLVTKPVGCGYSNPGAHVLRELASNNGYAEFGEFPWMVALLKKNVPGNKFHDTYIGGGTLIDASVVLTVAHKVDEIAAFDVNMFLIHKHILRLSLTLTNIHQDSSADLLACRAGEWNISTIDEVYPHQDRDARKIIIHEQYNRIYTHYDFALIILEKPFDLDDAPHIGVACLEHRPPQTGTECYSMGWGEDFRTGEKKYPTVLKKLKLPIVDGNKCQNQYRNSRLGSYYNLHKSFICAGGVPNVDTCLGDGGASLVCPVADEEYIRYSAVGMAMYGLECGINLPGVYAKIPEVYNWVLTQFVLEGFNDAKFKTL